MMCEKAGEVTAQTRSKSLQLGAIFSCILENTYVPLKSTSTIDIALRSTSTIDIALRSTSTLVTQKYVDTYCICLSNYITPNKSQSSLK